MNDEFPELRTLRLRLRQTVPDDAARLFEIHAQSKFMPWYGGDPVVPDVAAVRALIETSMEWQRDPARGARWTLELPESHEVVGTCALFDWRRDWQSCQLDFELSHAMRGRGLMREALTAVLAHGFDVLRLHRVESRLHHLNLAPMRLLRSIGFVQEGCLREAGHWDGHHHDLLVFGLLRPELRAKRFPPV
jgi:ribosomal-protein-alanine N-acetyltransferase